MNEKKMSVTVLILLVCLNLGLFGYYCKQKIELNWVPEERIEQVKAFYAEAGIDFAVEPDRNNEPKASLELEEADLAEMAERVLGESFDQSYIYGDKVQYTAGSVTILMDRKQNMIVYRDEAGQDAANSRQSDWWKDPRKEEEQERLALLPAAEEFAHQWLGDEVYLIQSQKQDPGFYFVFCQVYDEAVLYFNRLEITVTSNGVTKATLTYWDIKRKTEKPYRMYPIDEILYAQLGNIKKDQTAGGQDRVAQILEGYQLKETDENRIAVPSVTIVLESGNEYRMNRTES